MLNLLLAPAVILVEAESRREDRAPTLPCLDGSRREASSVAYPLNMVYDWNLRITGQDEVTVHTMNRKTLRNGALRRSQALSNHCSAVYPSSTGWMP